MNRLKLHIVDDHKLITDGLQMILSDHPELEVCNVARSGEMALAQMVECVPDILLLDYSLTDLNNPQAMNGLQTAEHVRTAYPDVKILMLSMHDTPKVIVPCIAIGVHGYMLKSERNMDVALAIMQLHRFGFYFSPSIARDLAHNIREHRQNEMLISDREKEVLEWIFKGANTKEIADALEISPHTVETHRKHLIQKFEARNSVHLIYLALKSGVLRVS